MIYFIRHGQTDANFHKLNAGGETDIPLNETGMAQARAFNEAHQEFLETIDTVFVSPMIRARQTMELVLGHHKKPVEIVDDLRERMIGEWAGLPYEATDGYFDTHPKDGESWPVFLKRSIDALRYAANKHAGKVLVVAHGGIWYSYASLSSHPLLHIDNVGREEVCRIKLSGL